MNIQYKEVSQTDTRFTEEALVAEETLLAEYYRKEAAFRDVIAKVNRNSLFAKIDAEAFENFCHDELPDEPSWRETIEEQYHG